MARTRCVCGSPTRQELQWPHLPNVCTVASQTYSVPVHGLTDTHWGPPPWKEALPRGHRCLGKAERLASSRSGVPMSPRTGARLL